jgi:hypothetical protein
MVVIIKKIEYLHDLYVSLLTLTQPQPPVVKTYCKNATHYFPYSSLVSLAWPPLCRCIQWQPGPSRSLCDSPAKHPRPSWCICSMDSITTTIRSGCPSLWEQYGCMARHEPVPTPRTLANECCSYHATTPTPTPHCSRADATYASPNRLTCVQHCPSKGPNTHPQCPM